MSDHRRRLIKRAVDFAFLAVLCAAILRLIRYHGGGSKPSPKFALSYEIDTTNDDEFDYEELVHRLRFQRRALGASLGAQLHRGVDVAIVEAWGVHDEVTASFLRALAPNTDVHVTSFLRDARFGIWELYQKFPWQNDYEQESVTYLRKAVQQGYRPAVVILTSCQHDVTHELQRVNLDELFTQTNARLWCVVHEAYEWSNGENEPEKRRAQESLRKWIDSGRISWITLSAHVNKTLDFTVFPTLQIDPQTASTHVWTPVFDWTEGLPVQVQESIDVEYRLPSATTAQDRVHLAVQGSFESHRRNYKDLFDSWKNYAHWHATSVHKTRLMDRVKFLILGQEVFWEPNPSRHLPADVIQTKTILASGLNYKDYYATLANATLLLPAFAGNEYLLWKASSTVAASVIACVPLVAEEELLKRYTYLRPSAVWLRGEAESELNAAMRIIDLPRSALNDRVIALQKLRAELIQENEAKVRRWMA